MKQFLQTASVMGPPGGTEGLVWNMDPLPVQQDGYPSCCGFG